MHKSKNIITLTSAAKIRIKEIISNAEKKCVGIRIGIDNTGCSGHSYKINYAENKNKGDEEIIFDDIKVFVDPSATMFILGSKIDYVDNGMESGFIFKNPNEKSRCGCGESFSV
tara:strand:- start:215 stop:556 length:342 start_codon:yes stop_codon:yes gene_type:complete